MFAPSFLAGNRSAVGTYTGVNFTSLNNAEGITTDSNYLYTISKFSDTVRRFEFDGVYTGFEWSVSPTSTNPSDIYWDESNDRFLVTDEGTKDTTSWSSSFVYQGIFISGASISGGGNPVGVTFDGSNYWLAVNWNGNDDSLQKFNASGVFISEETITSDPQSVAFYKGDLWVVIGSANDYVERYNLSAGPVGTTFITLPSTQPKGIVGVDGSFYICDSSDATVYKYVG